LKIAFIHSCLEPGRDGVGDYTIALASQCAVQGAEVSALAVNDPFVSGPEETTRDGVPCLRLPQSMTWRERSLFSRPFLDARAPDCVSLQFVCYAYAKRGLAFRLGSWLEPLVRGRSRHIMFHELWIGQDPGDPLKKRAVGWLQRRIIQSLVRSLRFDVVHSSNQYYLAALQRASIPARELPLFGAIPLKPTLEFDWIYEAARSAGWLMTPENRHQFLVCGFFGSIHPTWPPEPLLSQLNTAATRLNQRLVILSIGRQGAGGTVWDEMQERHRSRIQFLLLGEQPKGRVADYFGFLNYGLATTPRALIGKSGSVAAMVEHGLPVIVNRDEIPFAGEQTELRDSLPLLLFPGGNLTEQIVAGLARREPQPRLPKITARFLADLTSASFSQK